MKWDFVVLDMQHGSFTYETAHRCVYALRDNGTQPWVRTSVNTPSEIQKVLDIGAQVVVVPMVNSLAEAKDLAGAAKYPPLGYRSIGGDNHIHLGSDYPERANKTTKLIVQIEHVDAIQEVEKIMALPSVDGCFVGPVDLALSMNLSRDDYADNSEHQAYMLRILDACRVHEKLACCNTFSIEDAKQKAAQGFNNISHMSEVDLMMQAGNLLHREMAKHCSGNKSIAGSHLGPVKQGINRAKTEGLVELS